MSNISQDIRKFIDEIPIEDIIDEQDCTKNFTELYKIKKRPGQDSFYEAIKILNLGKDTCKTTWEISETPIGEISENGSIFKGSCDGNDKVYALKYVPLKGKTSYELKGIANEINMQQLIYRDTNYTTPIYQIFLNSYMMMFITDKLHITVYRYILQKLEKGALSRDDISRIKKIIHICYQMLYDLMANHEIVHNDEHLNNFMLTDDFNEDQFDEKHIKIIDFGKSYKLPHKKNNQMSIMMRIEVIKSIISSNINDIRFHKNCPSHASLLLPDELR